MAGFSMDVPVTLITGYLGSGKTTLLRRIAEESGLRLAIVMNEFGEIAIDGRVLEGKAIKVAELAGGCVCCSLSGEFSLAVAELIDTVKPEWIVVETTGVAEPAALAYDIKENIPGISLDSIVTVVDTDAITRFPSLGHTGREQIELADLIVLNKIDLVQSSESENVKRAIAGLNPRATIIESERCEIDTKILFGINREAPVPEHQPHKIDIEYFDFVSDGTLDHSSFERLAEKMPRAIFRSKGFVKTERGGFLFNHVAGRYSLEDFACDRTELVFIGKDALDEKDRIIASLERIRIKDDAKRTEQGID
jgi:G3E family GTPase